VEGDTYYLDLERIRKVDEYVYWWELLDKLKPTNLGNLSGKIYFQGDCKLFRLKILTYSYYKEPMGGGTPSTTDNKPKEWFYPHPDTRIEFILKKVCQILN